MNLPIFFTVLCLIGACVALPVFEWAVFTLLGGQILLWLGGKLGLPLSTGTTLLMLAVTGTALAWLIKGKRPLPSMPKLWDREYEAPLLFVFAYLLLFRLCLLWPDFVSIGERLRDYALLASNINDPIGAREPWMAGVNLNYYLYWYRFGHLLSTLFSWPTWQTYHALSAFSGALYIAALFRLFRAHLSFSFIGAVLSAGIIFFGSNVAGIRNYLMQDTNWWGPSRVIEGAIDEFPAWSFLLGDLHPHYVNLALTPLLLGTLFLILKSGISNREKTAATIAITSLGALWSWNANAWEVPFWGICVGACAVAGLLVQRSNKLPLSLVLQGQAPQPKVRLAVMSLLFILAAVSLWLSSKNIQPLGYPWKFVAPPVTRTGVLEMLGHFGIPLLLIAVSQIMLLEKWQAAVATAVIFVITLYAPATAVFFLIALFVASVLRAATELLHSGDQHSPIIRWDLILAHGIGLAGLLLVLIPEFVYLDDPYGIEIDRMNTIFKIYSAAWFMLHLYAFFLVRQALLRRVPQAFGNAWARVSLAAALVLMAGFFVQTIALRRQTDFTVSPKAQGLSSLDRQWAGAARAIKALEKAPKGIVLEAQGGAYNFSSHVSTLASKEAFLGWANHVELLTQKYDESRTRQETTDKVYNESDCYTRKSLLRDNKIAYLVVGPMEKQKYQGVDARDFSCMSTLVSAGEYRIFQVS